MIVRAECHALLGPINPGDQISDTWGMALATDHSHARSHGHTMETHRPGTLQGRTQEHKHALNQIRGQGRELACRQTCWAESFSHPKHFVFLLFQPYYYLHVSLMRWLPHWYNSVQCNCSTCPVLAEWKLHTLLKVTDRGFSSGGKRSQTFNTLCSHVYIFARFLIASARGWGPWGGLVLTKHHFVYPRISHSKNNQRW